MNYNKILHSFIITVCFALLISSCKKAEPIQTTSPQIVKVEITGNTTKDLEFVFKDSVIASGSANGSNFVSSVLLNVAGPNAEIKVREKGASAILDTWTVSSAFNQTFSIFYDGHAVYDGTVAYQIKGYAMAGELEFLLDGNVVAEGSLKIDQTVNFLINKDVARELQVRVKGTTTSLITKQILATPATGQSMKFFFDGNTIVDDVKLSPPLNPANMSITGQFKPVASGGTFKGGDVDLVFYVRNNAGVITVPNPQPRITMPASGAFVTFELPPLPDEESFYTYDICEVGSDALPYTNFPLAALYPPKLNKGKYGQLKFGDKYFEAGGSKLLLMQDAGTLKTSPVAERGRYVYGKITDLSEYFY